MDAVVLRPRDGASHDRPAFLDATFSPSQGFRIVQARGRLPNRDTVDLLHDSLSFGGAILLPFANRIRGRLDAHTRTIETNVLGRRVHLPANWRGRQPNSRWCAMHGLLYDRPMRIVEHGPDSVVAVLDAGDFGGYWPSQTFVQVTATLHVTTLALSVIARNTGSEPLPIGIGWHPYFAVPSGDRQPARLHIPAARRACVTNYDDVFPTGELVAVADTPYDFASTDGAPLGSLYLDDMFVDLQKTPEGHTQIEMFDAAARYHMRLTALSRQVSAVQVYAPPDQPFVVIEPQFNWADPFSDVWPPEANTGMVVLPPNADVTWAVQWLLLDTPPRTDV